MSISPLAATMLSWVYCSERHGFVGAPQPGASVPWPDTQARCAVCAVAGETADSRASTATTVTAKVLAMFPLETPTARQVRPPRRHGKMQRRDTKLHGG